MIEQFHTTAPAAPAAVWTSIPTVSVRTYASSDAAASRGNCPAQPSQAQPSAMQSATSASLESEEICLRRRLLFRLLKGFDFDKPVMQYEPIARTKPAQDLDTFEFNFESAV